jgi:glycosyltransferase involved in cell wall biosynthesis
MIKVLGLALYGPLAASNRYRVGQYVPGLLDLGIELETRHLLGDDYLRAIFSGKALPIESMLKAGFARLKDLFCQNDYDIIMLQCELFPLLPSWFERAMLCKPYFYDFDDAFYLKYRSGRMRVASPILGAKFDTVMAGAATVTAGNHLLAAYARQHNSNTYLLPTVVDTSRYLPHTRSRGSEVYTVGWIGSPSTATYLSELVVPLSAIAKEGPVRLIVVGGRAPKIPNVSVVEIDWHEHTELDLINSFDVGVMPLPDDDWARGKCAFKLIQYMACAVPVIASAVGANVDVVDADCGLLASTPQEWTDAFRLLRNEPAKRRMMGESGRARVVQHYSLHQNLPLLARVIEKTHSS